jgi:hypothetical protein
MNEGTAKSFKAFVAELREFEREREGREAAAGRAAMKANTVALPSLIYSAGVS